MSYEQPKKNQFSNWRVVVTPLDRVYGFKTIFNDNGYRGACEEIVEQIRRHVDSVGSVDVEFDSEAVCSFCGYGWKPDSDGYNQCCAKETEFWIKGNIGKAILREDMQDEELVKQAKLEAVTP